MVAFIGTAPCNGGIHTWNTGSDLRLLAIHQIKKYLSHTLADKLLRASQIQLEPNKIMLAALSK